MTRYLCYIAITLLSLMQLADAQTPYCSSILLNGKPVPPIYICCINDPIVLTMDTSKGCSLGDTALVKRSWIIDGVKGGLPIYHIDWETYNSTYFEIFDSSYDYFTITLRILDSSHSNGVGDTTIRTFQIKAHYCRPVSYIKLSADAICAGDCIDYIDSSRYGAWAYQFIFEGGNLDSAYIWEYNYHNIPVCYQDTGVFKTKMYYRRVDPTNPNGALIDSVFKNIHVRHCPICMAIPTAFTPNDDNVNDLYRVTVNCKINTLSIKIYNRWGTLVYQGYDTTTGWDGTYQGEPQPAGVYDCYISATHVDGIAEQRHQLITLIR
jgi:gliding motility-associated-like protein